MITGRETKEPVSGQNFDLSDVARMIRVTRMDRGWNQDPATIENEVRHYFAIGNFPSFSAGGEDYLFARETLTGVIEIELDDIPIPVVLEKKPKEYSVLLRDDRFKEGREQEFTIMFPGEHGIRKWINQMGRLGGVEQDAAAGYRDGTVEDLVAMLDAIESEYS